MDAEQQYNIVNVELRGGRDYDLRPLERHFYTSSACGVCGKASLEQLELRGCPVVPPGPRIPAEKIYASPRSCARLKGSSRRPAGCTRRRSSTRRASSWRSGEDVGRHNATDKLVGWALLERRLPLSDHIVMVSGRSSFEILQKSLIAGAPIVWISAPSSLAVDVARQFGMTLIGFLRGERFNVYAGEERIAL